MLENFKRNTLQFILGSDHSDVGKFQTEHTAIGKWIDEGDSKY
ncbi:hypothetical protein B425_2262 [Bacillus amyloliquefaciens]|nr:hypothetical protein B425_2262 [Bacillus amyloliquefaciens]CDG26629.1 protein of unknown function [Bacillus velezensis UCMB5113]